ncbi:unnamed protein product [Meloidogyne enterolobii]|uniref:Uncharacterized protein n=1 Tax=Meloidogyne enterolobii TaxID=390850 RepID=A0ACB0ZJ42_MELEN
MSQQCITEQPQLTGYAKQLDDKQNEIRWTPGYNYIPVDCCFWPDCSRCSDCADCCNHCLPTDCMECLGHIFCCCSLASNPNSGCDCSGCDCSGLDCGNVDCGGDCVICCCA